MNLDPNKYMQTLVALTSRLQESKDIERTCTEFSVSSHVPLLAITLYAMQPEVCGEMIELRTMAESLTKFYGYTKVEGWEKA